MAKPSRATRRFVAREPKGVWGNARSRQRLRTSRPRPGAALRLVAIPREINWTALSPGSRETVRFIAVRMSAGYSLDDIATVLRHSPPDFRFLVAPPGGVSKHWVSAPLRDLRTEIASPARRREPRQTVKPTIPPSVIRVGPDGTTYHYRPEFLIPDRFVNGKPVPPMPNARRRWVERRSGQVPLPGRLER